MIPGSLARRYARALIELADNPTRRDTFGRDLARFAAAMDEAVGEGATLGSILGTERYPQGQRRGVLLAVCQRLRADGIVTRFLDYVFGRGRIAGVAQMSRFYDEMADERAGRVQVEVTAARPLSAAASRGLQAALEQATGKTVIMKTAVDPTLIGGLRAQIGSTVVDGSVRTSLAHMRAALREPGAPQRS